MREIAKRVSLRLDSAEYAHLKRLSADTGLKMGRCSAVLLWVRNCAAVRLMN